MAQWGRCRNRISLGLLSPTILGLHIHSVTMSRAVRDGQQVTTSARFVAGDEVCIVAVSSDEEDAWRRMNAVQFVENIKGVVYEASVEDVMEVLSNPPGRRPRPQLTKLSEWASSCP